MAFFKTNYGLIERLTITATSGGTLTLANNSRTYQQLTGVTTHTVTLPQANSNCPVSLEFTVMNRSTGAVTVNYFGGSLAKTLAANTQATFRLVDNSTSAGTWDITNEVGSGGATASLSPLEKLAALAGLSNSLYLDSETDAVTIKVNPEEIGGNYWLTRASLSALRRFVGTFTLNGFTYGFTGENSGRQNTNERFNLDSNSFLSRQVYPITAQGISGGSSGTSGFGFGGFNAPATSAVYEYSDLNNTWTSRTALTAARYDSSNAVLLNGFLYMIGGTNGISIQATNEMYNYATYASHVRTPLPVGRSNPSIVATPNFILALGGENGGVVSTVYNFSDVNNSWTTVNSLSYIRCNGASFYTVGRILMPSGSNGTATPITTSLELNPDSMVYATRSGMTVGRYDCAQSGENTSGMGIVFGGSNSGGNLSSVESRIAASFFQVPLSKKSTAVPTSIFVGAALNAVATSVPVRLRTDGDAWEYFEANKDGALKFGETLGAKFTAYGNIAIAGGQDSTTEIASAESYNEEGNSWSARSSIPLARQGIAGFTVGGLGHAAGGQLSGTTQTTNYQFNDVTNAWATRQPLTQAVWAQGQSFSIREIGYLASGRINGSTVYASIQAYDYLLNTWAVRANPSVGRWGGNSFVLGERGYLISGVDAASATFYTNSEKYEPITNVWANLANAIPAAQFDGASSAMQGFGYVFAGFNSAFTVLNTVRRLNPADETWTTVANLPASRASSPSATRSLAGFLYVTGGSNGGANVSDHYQYNFNSNSWATRASMGTVRARAAESNPGPYRNYELQVGLPTYLAALGSGQWINRVSFTNPNSKYSNPGDALEGHAYSLGGYNGSLVVYASTEKYNDELNTSTAFVLMNNIRASQAVFALQGLLFSCCGDINEVSYDVTNTNEYLNPTTNSWVNMANNAATGVGYVFGGKLNGFGYKTGGRTAALAYQSLNERLNPSTLAWTTMTGMPTARANSGSGSFSPDGFMYNIGGFITGTTYAINERYNDAANSWISRASMAAIRQAYFGGVVSGSILVARGTQTTTEMYTPAINAWVLKTTSNTAEDSGASATLGSGVVKIGGSNITNVIEKYTPAIQNIVLGAGLRVS